MLVTSWARFAMRLHEHAITITHHGLLLLGVQLELLNVATWCHTVRALGTSQGATTTTHLVSRHFKNCLLPFIDL